MWGISVVDSGVLSEPTVGEYFKETRKGRYPPWKIKHQGLNELNQMRSSADS